MAKNDQVTLRSGNLVWINVKLYKLMGPYPNMSEEDRTFSYLKLTLNPSVKR